MCQFAEKPLPIGHKRYGTNAPAGSPRRRPLRWWDRLQRYIDAWKANREREEPHRTIHINDHERNRGHFCSNKISTTKYNLITFFPFFLFDQFRRYANLFFLFIIILQVCVCVCVCVCVACTVPAIMESRRLSDFYV